MTNLQTTTDTTLREIADSIGVLRRVNGMSQVALGKYSGVPQKTISRMESGKSLPTVNTLQMLAEVFGYHIELSLVPKETKQPEE